MNLKENLGKNIHKYRKLNGITQEKLAEMIDVEINSISSIERGRFFPSPDNLVKLTNALNISFAELFTFTDDYSCDDYQKEILKNIELVKKDKSKLAAINSFIKSIL